MRTDERFEERLLDELRALVEERREPAPPRRSRRRLAVAAAVAATAAAIFGVLAVGDRTPLRSGPEWAAAALQVANSVPRLAVHEPGWKVVRADEFSVDQGEMTFSDGRHSVDLSWRDGRLHRSYVKDREHDTERLGDAEVDGEQAMVFAYDKDDFTALWRSGGYSLELRSGLADPEDRLEEDDFLRVLESLEQVSVDAWLAAMPASVVRPGARAETVAEMLEGIPTPDGFDRQRLSRGDAVKDRYQLGARVSGAVACAWIRQWLKGRRTGDDRAVREAVEAMRTSRQWRVIL